MPWTELTRLSLRLSELEASSLSCPRDRSILLARIVDLRDMAEGEEIDLRESETTILRTRLAELRSLAE